MATGVLAKRILKRPVLATELPKVQANFADHAPSMFYEPLAIVRNHPKTPALIAVFEQGHPSASFKEMMQMMAAVRSYTGKRYPLEVWSFHTRSDRERYNHREIWAIYHGTLSPEDMFLLRRVRRSYFTKGNASAADRAERLRLIRKAEENEAHRNDLR